MFIQVPLSTLIGICRNAIPGGALTSHFGGLGGAAGLDCAAAPLAAAAAASKAVTAARRRRRIDVPCNKATRIGGNHLPVTGQLQVVDRAAAIANNGRMPDAEPSLAAAPPRGDGLSQIEIIGQSIANVGPTLTPAINITVVAALAGPGSWLAYLVATAGMMCVAANIGGLARRHPQSGSYFLYIGRNFGPLAGALAGWAMVAAYLFTAIAITLACSLFVSSISGALGLTGPSAWVTILGVIGLVGWAGYRDIGLSSRLALWLEGVSIAIILAIISVVASRHGTLVDRAQLDIAALPAGSVIAALPFAVFSFVGFESAATLARETRNPAVAIPRAIMGSAIGVGLFFAAIAYLMVLGMDGDAAAIGATSAPFAELAARAGLGRLAGVVYAAALISGFACVLASVNAAARLLFSMGRYGFFASALGDVHVQHRTPHVAVLAACALVLVISLALLPLGALLAFGLAGTFATLGFLLVYLGVCIVAPVDLRRSGTLRARDVAVAVAGVAMVGFVIIGSLWPAPAPPYDLLPAVFALYMAGGALWFWRRDRGRPGVFAALEHDLEG
jgi:amino acid transporter